MAALNYVDGTRSLTQIARLVTGELGAFPLTTATGFFELLAQAGVVEWG